MLELSKLFRSLVSSSIIIYCTLILLIVSFRTASSSNVHITDDNWDQILEGEWMVEFFAPWCPACRNLQPVWAEFASWGKDLGIRIGQVDITNSPGLSGRFMITALPTIYHIKDGAFRQYRNSRTKNDFLMFIEEKKWEEIEPISSWQSPASFLMSVISQFYRLSMSLRNFMQIMTQEYGLPAWGTYLIFGGATITLGLILGLLLVCVIDFIYPPKKIHSRDISSPNAHAEDKKDEDDELEVDEEELYEEENVDKNQAKEDSLPEEDESEKSTPPSPIPGPSSSANVDKIRRRTKRID